MTHPRGWHFAAKRRSLVVLDAAAWVLATLALVGARYDFTLNQSQWTTVALYSLAAVSLQVATGFATRLYPVAARATGVGAAVSVGRLGAIASGYVGAWALGLEGSRSFFGLVGVAMAACFVSLAIIGRHVERRRA